MVPAEILSISNAFEVDLRTTLLNGAKPENSTYPFDENEPWFPFAKQRRYVGAGIGRDERWLHRRS